MWAPGMARLSQGHRMAPGRAHLEACDLECDHDGEGVGVLHHRVIHHRLADRLRLRLAPHPQVHHLLLAPELLRLAHQPDLARQQVGLRAKVPFFQLLVDVRLVLTTLEHLFKQHIYQRRGLSAVVTASVVVMMVACCRLP